MFSLKEKKALVTGSSRGIGRGIALVLAAQGADVVVNYHSSQKEAEAVVGEIKKMGRRSFSVQADMGNPDDVVRMFDKVGKEWSGLDILVNNAGILQFKPFEEITVADWDRMLNINLRGQFLCIQQAVKLMGKGGRIINISSISSGGVGVAYPQISHYTTAKGGVVGLTEALAVELGPKGINVNAIAPGSIDTDMTKQSLTDEKVKQALISRVPKKRIGKPKDIGYAAAFLASPEADYVTGVVLYVDGGWLAS